MPSEDVSLESVLLAAVRDAVPERPGFRATVSLDVEDGDPWTIRLSGGRVWITPGLHPRADTTVTTDAVTLAAVMDGSRSGVEAFLAGDLRVRGNLALSLRLGGLFQPEARPARFPVARTAAAGPLSTFYLEAGQGPPVVLLHGLGATNASLLPTLWDLARDHRVLVPDMPGFGDSSKPLRRYDSAFFARWLEAFLDEAGVERADLVGNSMGGRVAIEMGLVHPERTGRLVLLTPSPAFIRRRHFVRLVRLLRPELAVVRVPMRHALVVGGIKRMFARPERLPQAWYLAAADEFLRVFSTMRGRVAFFSAARQIYLEEPYGEVGFWDRLPQLDVPALFVWGDRDRLVPARFARHVERALPSATSVVLDDCGHVPQFEHPDLTHGLIREFLS
ncbi:MAG TPA: alpha/beta fold hydrolase [Actinomycetota bacterium]|nr:alpha/beta fold hydrolase [Actinomycetota bacterium]